MSMYGKFTWKIEHFSTITKRELRSNVFEVGGYKWYDKRGRGVSENEDRSWGVWNERPRR